MLVGLSDSKNNAITIVEILAIMMLAGLDYRFISTKIKHEALVHQQPQIQVAFCPVKLARIPCKITVQMVR